MQPSIPIKISAYLNHGDVVVAEVHSEVPGARCFVRIRPRPNPEVPREERRYLNSKFTMWEYWHYQFRRMLLRPGWEAPEFQNDYDLFLLQDEKRETQTESDFYELLTEWVPDLSALKHVCDSDCPE
jgi:hypothetical protein